ncbi:DnaB-like helicase C-terminal domain-containing protein [Hymenobacter terrenus]|uniref:DnaB-like helicase C-terminal domain-containing protein n=1 Tax=Hymenobacter terrenus TaxID=1629124 RepID=UPI00373FD41A
MLSDLRESGSLEQDADCIVFLWRGEYYYNIAEYKDGTATTDTILFNTAKHRNGATDEVIAACSMRRGVFLRPQSRIQLSQSALISYQRPSYCRKANSFYRPYRWE